jgi:hypothetical protein
MGYLRRCGSLNMVSMKPFPDHLVVGGLDSGTGVFEEVERGEV